MCGACSSSSGVAGADADSTRLDLLTRMQTKSDRLVAVEAARCFRQLSNDLQALGIEPPDLPAMTRDALSDWALSTSALLVRSGR